METKKIMTGAIIWSIGLIVPLGWHALLIDAAMSEDGNHGYTYHFIVKSFFDLPWVVWPYTLAMTVLGFALMISGLCGKPSQ